MNEIKKGNESKGLFLSLVGVLTLIVAIAGATYAWFTASNSNAGITGSASSTGLTLNVVQNLPVNKTAELIPQVGSAINTAVSQNCIDGAGNAICQTYTVTVTNDGDSKVILNGEISFGGIDNMPNLKYSTSTTSASSGYGVATAATTSNTELQSGLELPGGESDTIYVVVWIEEANEAQDDSGTYTATVTYSAANGEGVTSTITS